MLSRPAPCHCGHTSRNVRGSSNPGALLTRTSSRSETRYEIHRSSMKTVLLRLAYNQKRQNQVRGRGGRCGGWSIPSGRT